MKKYKVLKPINLYENTEITSKDDSADDLIINRHYSISNLIDSGYIKEIIDIEAIRRSRFADEFCDNRYMRMNNESFEFHKAYEVVKAVIDQLNDGWKPEWKLDLKEIYKYQLFFDHGTSKFSAQHGMQVSQFTLLPPCKTKEITWEVMKLCEPELKVLFGVK